MSSLKTEIKTPINDTNKIIEENRKLLKRIESLENNNYLLKKKLKYLYEDIKNEIEDRRDLELKNLELRKIISEKNKQKTDYYLRDFYAICRTGIDEWWFITGSEKSVMETLRKIDDEDIVICKENPNSIDYLRHLRKKSNRLEKKLRKKIDERMRKEYSKLSEKEYSEQYNRFYNQNREFCVYGDGIILYYSSENYILNFIKSLEK